MNIGAKLEKKNDQEVKRDEVEKSSNMQVSSNIINVHK